MSLTNRENAFIQPEKLIDYLLSENHPVGKSKAKFFRELGFNEENVTFLEQELSKIVRNQDVTEVITTEHGTKYVIIGTINTPKNKSVTILTVWIIDLGKDKTRFVTARPFFKNKG
ncbi:MAG: DUF6883 domain-containing protein [Microcystis sp.]